MTYEFEKIEYCRCQVNLKKNNLALGTCKNRQKCRKATYRTKIPVTYS